MRISKLILLLVPVLLWSPDVVLGQTVGSIAGVVRDATGALLPGVTVEASSPVLIEKVRVAQTDEQGQYKIVDLRPGVYTVTFTLAGFSASKREGVELTTGFTATVNGDLKLGAVEETITVTGATPVVDIHNVVAHNVFSSKVLQSLPTPNTNYASLAALIPGATLGSATHQNVGGNQAEQATMGLHGMNTDQRLLIDGMRYGSMEGTGTTRTWAHQFSACPGNNRRDERLGRGGNRRHPVQPRPERWWKRLQDKPLRELRRPAHGR
jgi:hypothetical protein